MEGLGGAKRALGVNLALLLALGVAFSTLPLPTFAQDAVGAAAVSPAFIIIIIFPLRWGEGYIVVVALGSWQIAKYTKIKSCLNTETGGLIWAPPYRWLDHNITPGDREKWS